MTQDIVRRGMALCSQLGVFLLLSFSILSQIPAVQAANLSSLRDTMTSSKVSTTSNHTITFRSASGVSSGTIVVNLTNVVASAGSVDYTDVDLQYSGVDAVLAATAAVNTWGVTVSGGLVTFTYPTSCTSPCSAISRGATVTVLIGTNASGGDAQMTNVSTTGSKYVSIAAGSDVGLFAVSLLSSNVSAGATADIPSGTSSSAASTPTPSSPQTAPASSTPASSTTAPSPSSPTTTSSTPTTPAVTPTPSVQKTTTPTPSPSSQPATPTSSISTPPTEQPPPVPVVVNAPIASPDSVTVPAVSTGGVSSYVVGATNAVGGGGVQAVINAGTFLSQAGKRVPVKADVTPMPFDVSTVWTGCSALKKLNILGKLAYRLSAINTAAENPGDVAVQAQQPVTFIIHYTQQDVDRQGIIENTIKAIAFDPEDCNQPLEYTLDIEKKNVTVLATPKTFFALTGETLSGFIEKETVAYPTFEITPIQSPISTSDFQAKDTATNNALTLSDDQFVATQNSTIDMCLSSKLFKKPVKKIILSIASTRYPFRFDTARDCFAAKIKIPAASGAQDVELKIIYIDDQVQVIKLKTLITSEFQANLLTYAIPLLNTIQALNEQVGKTVEQNQPLIQTTAAVTVPVVGVANPSLVTNALNWYYYINHFFSWLLSLLGIRKKRRSWGVVYNAITKMPVDLVIVRLFEKATNRLIETQVTDKSGRFSFLTAPGEYYITATKNPLVFPSHIVKGSIDGDYAHIYRQESFAISTSDQAMTLSIPLDPPAFDHEAVAKKLSPLKWWKTFVGKNPLAPLFVGFIISEVLVLYIPTSLNYTLLGFNGFFLITQVVLGLRSEKAWGLVFDTMTLAPVPLAAITIFDAQEGKMLRTRLTDYFGRFSFLTPTGKYMLAVTKEGYQFPAPKELPIHKYRHLYHGEPFDVRGRKTYIKTNIPVVPQKHVEQRPSLSTEQVHAPELSSDLPVPHEPSERVPLIHEISEQSQPPQSSDLPSIPQDISSSTDQAQAMHNTLTPQSAQPDQQQPPSGIA